MNESDDICTLLFGFAREGRVMRGICFLGLIVMLIFLSGCAIIDTINKDKMNNEREIRLENKERELKALQDGIQKKKEKNAKLISQLQVELRELERQLKEFNEIKKGKQAALSDIAALKGRLADLDSQLGQLKKELAYGSGGPGEEKIGEKKRQIEELRNDIEIYLRMGSN